MKLSINGKECEMANGTTISDILEHHGLNPDSVIVELNRRIISSDAFSTILPADGDALEFIRVVGGG